VKNTGDGFLRVSAASRMIALKPMVGCVSGSLARLARWSAKGSVF
jgi:hypothetical protein